MGYGKLSWLRATCDLGQMYAAPRLYLNFFQPSFKLKSKTRDGARVQKKYHAPTTPCDRLLALPEVAAESKAALREQFNALDPVLLLQTIRDGQQRLAELSGPPSDEPAGAPDKADVASFLHSLSTAWKDGEVRPTQRKQPGAARWWKTRPAPFALTWPMVEQWLMRGPTVTAKELFARLASAVPDPYAGTSQPRTLQRRVQQWRAEQAKNLVLGSLALARLSA